MENIVLKPLYDESRDLEIIYDFHKSQIFRINSSNANDFLAIGKQFDQNVVKKIDDQGRLRLIYVADKIPPLSAIMKHIETPYPEVRWGVYAVILPKDVSILTKISPIISYALNITELKNKYAIKIFTHEHRDNMKEVIEWQDQNMEVKSQGFIDQSVLGSH